ncbi:(d)CMP kinase [Erysipelothrix rhusiopathiae]|uniref:Cytidylate kinase n=1 Tax=Erysipelothrix rhusiopathiae ATCC 19414 TaxID=525280 RepID=E7FVA1_ERYRH|nr:(d)CMP kinase [Erysipelothrix rhusiopathiae]EFY09696.1 cytidylate kinase [Erysipelothrix rhusiopathiae ATCC 19414]MDE8256694.1 (d)CMP kinase [Erysipelothrix rhusiopathiae]MDE8339593.1 (d)CMP kinase [Erysipelothrix rhusiopathiae]MDE8341808.1 (d)CMP kinase [Erysipelothrix rhusiopathiae]MDV7679957.1 (d)CMP kinase [Erysipelothrix rhusiopathiae]
MFNIAIDGPSASGKSTIAKQLAKKLGFVHIDTGAMYRAVALICLNQDIDLNDEKACFNIVKDLKIELPEENMILVNGQDVSLLIRNDKVSKAASQVSKHRSVRDVLVSIQRDIASKKGFVLDGRDITSVVLPDAEVKIFQTADASVRARRRYNELIKNGIKTTYEEVHSDLVERDERDMNRQESPLIKVEDAIEINTTSMSIEEVVSQIVNIIESRNLND